MKKFLKKLPTKLMTAVMTLALVAGMASQAMAAFGPDRETRAYNSGLNGFDHVQFNSFTGVGLDDNNPNNDIGDERDFLRGVQVGRDSVWSDPVTNFVPGEQVEVKIYIHNNASDTLNESGAGVAKDVNVRVAIPDGGAINHQITSYISASNATPGTIWDTLDIKGASGVNVHEIAYVPGSAKMFDHETGQTTAISDSLVTTGASLPDQKGCFDYIREITFRVVVPNYTVKKQVRLPGQTKNDWKENLNVKLGDTVEWKIEFKNTGVNQLDRTIILDEIPAGLTVVPGSIKLYDGNFPNGVAYEDSKALQANGRQINVSVGKVNPGINSVIMFQTKVNTDAVKCGTAKIVNNGYATPGNLGSIKDDASVTVDSGKTCETTPPEELPRTGAGSVIGLFSVVTLIGAVAHNLLSRRASL